MTCIAAALSELGAEVLRADYPFNYSRINNDAIQRSVRGREFPLVLFLNNDVILDPGAIAELAFWARQPGIGAVGARLRYPSGQLQHGGIEISEIDSGERIAWAHTDHGQEPEALAFAKIPRVVEAVTAACALVSRAAFESVGGFDEDLYPVAYSDTDLCRRLRRAGLYSFYTPFATGEHHESLTRGVNPYEDLESSRWLHVHARDRGIRKYVKFLSNHRLEH
jgi:GT2 family glycosyltransferase